MTTIGYFEQTRDLNDLFFKTVSGEFPGFNVLSFSEGIVEIETLPTSNIEDVLDAVMGCFETCSNFFQETRKAYNMDENCVCKGIKFTHYDVTILVTADTADKYFLLYQYWKERYYALADKHNMFVLSTLEG